MDDRTSKRDRSEKTAAAAVETASDEAVSAPEPNSASHEEVDGADGGTEEVDGADGRTASRKRIRTSGLPIKPKIQCTQPCTTDFSENMGYPTEEMANATAQ